MNRTLADRPVPDSSTDSVTTRRAVFIDDRLLRGDLAGETARELHRLTSWYRVVIVGNGPIITQPDWLMAERVARKDSITEFCDAMALERYASWYVGPGKDLGFRGVLPVTRTRQLPPALESIRAAEERSKIIIDEHRLGTIVAALRKRRSRIVFTNGVFDLIHIGHLRLLDRARRLGDVLMVGINSDDSTRRIKGPSRPVVPQFARAETLVDLRAVDFCVVFTEPDPLHVLSIIMPQVLVKGSDYPLHRVVGRRFVEGYGGEIVRLPLVEGCSTTSTISRIVARRPGGSRHGR